MLRPVLPPLPNPADQDEPNQYQRMGIAYTIPLMLVAPIIALLLLGAWLDSKLHRAPLFTLGGALVGTIVGFMNMIRTANRLNR